MRYITDHPDNSDQISHSIQFHLENIQKEIMRIGGREFSIDELSEMTISKLLEMLTRNNGVVQLGEQYES